MKRLLSLFTLLTVISFSSGCEKYEAPSSVRNTFKEQYPSAVDVEWERKHGYVVVDFYLPGTGE